MTEVSNKPGDVTHQQVVDFIEATHDHAGPAATKILNEVGPCGWDKLMKEAKAIPYPALGDVVLGDDTPAPNGDQRAILWDGLRGGVVPISHSQGPIPPGGCPVEKEERPKTNKKHAHK